MRCVSHIFSKYLSNLRDFVQSYRGVNIYSCTGHFLCVHEGFLSNRAST